MEGNSLFHQNSCVATNMFAGSLQVHTTDTLHPPGSNPTAVSGNMLTRRRVGGECGATCAQDAYNAEHYTEFGIQHVEGTTFKSLLLRHYPELEASIGDVRFETLTLTLNLSSDTLLRLKSTVIYQAVKATAYVCLLRWQKCVPTRRQSISN